MRDVSLGLIAFLLAAAPPAVPPDQTIEVDVANVRNAAGHIKVDVCTRETFLKDCPWSVLAKAHVGTVVVEFHGVPPGRYAIQVFHDTNDNGECDQGLFGIPKEAIGFSNDAMKGLSRPKFDNAAFTVDGRPSRLLLHLRHARLGQIVDRPVAPSRQAGRGQIRGFMAGAILASCLSVAAVGGFQLLGSRAPTVGQPHQAWVTPPT